MNMMNLPPPFGPPTPAPPLVGGEDGEVSEVESEVGSEGEGRGHDPARAMRPRREVKRRAAHLRPSRGASPPAKKRRPSASEPQFELPPLVGSTLTLSPDSHCFDSYNVFLVFDL